MANKLNSNNFRSYAILFIPFLLLSIGVLFYAPLNPIKDEIFFYPIVVAFGNLSQLLYQINHLTVPMGPLFFIIMGLIGRLFDFSIVVLRMINVLIGFVSSIFIYHTLKIYLSEIKYTNNHILLLTFWCICNPYFLFLTTPFLYTDGWANLFVFAGLYCYLRNQRLSTALLLGFSVLVRQSNLIIALAVLMTDIFYFKKTKKGWILYDLIPFIMFFVLFTFWDFNISSPSNLFTNISLKSFNYTPQHILQTIYYSLIYFGIYSFPFWFSEINKLRQQKWLFIISALLSIPMLYAFPRFINQGTDWSYITAGYLDKSIVMLGIYAYFIVPVFVFFSLTFFLYYFLQNKNKQDLFFKLSIALFFVYLSVSFYYWDKYLIPIVLFIILLVQKKRTNFVRM